MAGPWNGHDYSFYGPPAGPYYEGHLAPEHALPLRPLSTRRPRSRDTRESSSSRRHSLHRNYHSDNEAADEEPWEESSGTNEQTYANPLALVEQSGHTSGTGATNRLHSKPQRPSPAGFRYYSDTWYTGSHPTMPYMQSAPLQGDGHTPYPHGGNFMAQPQPTALQGDAHMPYRHEGNFFDNVPHPPASERGKKKSRIRRMRSSSLGAPIMEHSAERTAPHLRRRSPSPSITEPANIRAPSPPRPFVHRQSSVRVGRSGRERERKPGRTPAQSSHEELDFSSYSSDPESAPPGMKTFRKDRAKKSDSQFRIPGGFPLGESLRPDDSKSESSEYQQREQKKWKKKRSSQVPSQSPGRTTASTSSASGVLGVKHYQYRPLESMQFRLIKILPAKMSTIRCEIFSASLQKPPPYVAVSYAWGDPDDTRKIVLRDPETSTAVSIPVAVSLYGALKALRQKQEPAMIWVDYLCIDQQNRDERTEQVQFMTHIYTNATSVAVWLGPEADNSDLASKLLENFAAVRDKPDKIQSLIASQVGKPGMGAIVSLFERDYWRRLWVVQEVFNAKTITVYCGSQKLPWHTYRLASYIFWRHRTDIDFYFPGTSAPGFSQSISSNQSSYSQALVHQGPSSLPDVGSLTDLGDASLLEIMRACRPKLTSDPRDKVFGILGILPEDTRAEFPIDYSLSVKEVYTNVVDYLLSTTERLDIIRESIHFPQPSTNGGGTPLLPSWIPDWSHIPGSSTSIPTDLSASRDTKAEYRLLDSRRKLEISAIYLDSVSTRGIAVGTLCTDVADYLMAFLHWRALLLGSNDADDDGGGDEHNVRVQEAFCRTLSLGQIPTEYGAPRAWMTACYHVFASLTRELIPRMPLDRELRSHLKTNMNIQPDARRAFLQHHFAAKMMGRCLCVTEEGHIGMGSGFMAVGDVVVVPLGCATPVVLRPEGQRGEFRFVGDVYVHGYMEGKAVDQWELGQRQMRKFVIH